MENTKQLWSKIINDARLYDGSPEMLGRLIEHYQKWYDIKEKEQVKEVPDCIPVRIERCLHSHGYKPYSVSGYPHKIIGHNKNFHTLKELKEYFGITSVVKDDKGWALTPKGKKVEWDNYTAVISKRFIL